MGFVVDVRVAGADGARVDHVGAEFVFAEELVVDVAVKIKEKKNSYWKF